MDFDRKKSREWQFNFCDFSSFYRKCFSLFFNNEIAFSIKCKFPLFEAESKWFVASRVKTKCYIIVVNRNKCNISTLQIHGSRINVNFCIGAFFQKSFYYAVDICFSKN